MINAGYDEIKLQETAEVKASLLSDFLLFTQVFYKLRTGREFRLLPPIGRENHCLTIAKALEKVWRGESTKLMINIAPRHGKSEMLIHWCAWCMAINPACNFIYVSLSYDLAVKATAQIKDIMQMPYYKRMFGVSLRVDSQAKGNFQTEQGGVIYACGSGGTLTGFGSGCLGATEFYGAVILDDLAKPQEILSPKFRLDLQEWFFSTLWSRRNDSEKTPIVMISQRLHEDDLCAYLLNQGDWDSVILKEIDEAGNALCPSLLSLAELRRLEEQQNYVFQSQYMQNPISPGAGLFKEEYFPILDKQPDILMTCIVCDTASSTKEWADYTVFGFFGIYEIKHFDKPTGLYGIHWLDCLHERIEPKDLQIEFMAFYASCCAFGQTPKFAAIERKSTGETLVSILSTVQGLNIIPIERNRSSGSKIDRFINCQPYVSQKLVTFPYGGKHVKTCINEIVKITVEGSARHDDITDVMSDIIKMVCIDKSALFYVGNRNDSRKQADKLLGMQTRISSDRMNTW